MRLLDGDSKKLYSGIGSVMQLKAREHTIKDIHGMHNPEEVLDLASEWS